MNVASGKVIAGCFALSAFAVAIIAGLASANPAAQILLNAVVAMIFCYVLGLFVGLLCERVIASHLLANERANPAVDSNLDNGKRSAFNGQSSNTGATLASGAEVEEPIIV